VHDPVRNARVIENGPCRHKPSPLVEADGAHLRVRHGVTVASARRHVEKPPQDCGPHAETPPRRQHRHSSDMAVGQDPSGTDGCAQGVQRQCVNTRRVVFVPFEGRGYSLLLDENLASHGGQARLFHRPGHQIHAKRGRIHGYGF